jgi:hypothetical protein
LIAEQKEGSAAQRPTLFCCYRSGLHVVREHDVGHGAIEQTSQNTTAQTHPHGLRQSLPLNVWPGATVAGVPEGKQRPPGCAPETEAPAIAPHSPSAITSESWKARM